MSAKHLGHVRGLVAFALLVAMTACGGGGSGATTDPVGGGGAGSSGDADLPTVSPPSIEALGIGGADYDALNNSTQRMRWAYYRDETDSRWYISEAVGGGQQFNVYSLTQFSSSGENGWGTVGEDVATIDLYSQLVHVDPNLDTDPSDRYWDEGWLEWAYDSSIHYDRQLIQGSTVPILWYFFKADANGVWYIVIAPPYHGATGDILKFARKTTASGWTYDWIPVEGLTHEVFMDGGQRKCRFESLGSSAAWTNVLRGGENTVTHGQEMRAYYTGSSCQSRTLLDPPGIVYRDDPAPPTYDFYMNLRHIGIDIAPRGDSAVHPIAPGTLIAKATSTSSPGYNGYGYWCILQHQDSIRGTYYSLYGHFAGPVSTATNSAVNVNMVLGTAGNTGTSFGPHVHLEVRRFHNALSPYHPSFGNAYGIETSGPTSACVQWNWTTFNSDWIDPKTL